MVTIAINPARSLGTVSGLVFGSFIENLNRCIYGGVFDPASPTADDDGFRQDVLDAARSMGVSNVRFPGGTYSAYYHWRDGVGDSAARPVTLYRSDGEWPSSNAFGTDEFITWCRKLDAEPYICVNMGSGSAEEARDWVEYCNAPVGSRWSDLRAANGHSEPYGVKYWGLGNEISAPWELGYTSTPEEYIERARNFAVAMKAADPSIKLTAAGAHFPIDFPRREWNRMVVASLHEHIDWVSIHHYIGHDYKDDIMAEWPSMTPDEAHYRLSEWMQLLDDALDIVGSDITLINHELNSHKPIGIAVDEFNPWYKTVGGSDELTERYSLSDALLVGSYFSMFIRHADTVTLANMAQLVNTLPAIVVESGGSRSYRQGISLVQELFSASAGHRAIDTWCDSPRNAGVYFPDFPLLDVSGTLAPDGRTLFVHVTNRSDKEEFPLEFQIVGGVAKIIDVKGLGDAALDSANDFTDPNRIRIEDLGVEAIIRPASQVRFTLSI
jgi:alpha-N-arabinofuranosidase